MARYIDADDFFRTFEELDIEPYNNFPTTDVVDVVRCKDCAHYQPSLFGEKNMCFRKDVDGVQICYDFSPDDYCSYGERRE